GTVLSGQLAVDEPVSLLPRVWGPLRARVLQTHGRERPMVRASERAAVNVPGAPASEGLRGLTLTRAGELPVGRVLDVEVEVLRGVAARLPKRSKLMLHLG